MLARILLEESAPQVSRFYNIGTIKMAYKKIFNIQGKNRKNLILQTDVGPLTEFDLFEVSLFHRSC